MTRALAAVALALCAQPAAAVSDRHFEHRWRRLSQAPRLPHPEILHPESPVAFPSGFVMTVHRRAEQVGGPHEGPISRPRDVAERLADCWTPPTPRGGEITVRALFNRRGAVIGAARVSYVRSGDVATRREAFIASIQSAMARCAPLPFTQALGAAIAGYPFAIRFVADGVTHPTQQE